jgi:hypothetical protein
MRSARRTPILVASWVAAAIAGFSASAAEASVDTTRLPRAEGAHEVFANPAVTSLTTPGTVAQAAETYGKLLAAAGWQQYVWPFASRKRDLPTRIMLFKKGAQALTVFVRPANAQGGATGVSYTATLLATDLPFIADAAEIEYSAEQPYLKLITGETVEATLAFYAHEMGALGWSLASTGQDAGAYYVRDGHKPLMLTIARIDAGKLKVEIKALGNPALAAVNDGGHGQAATARTRLPDAAAPTIGAIDE